MQQIRTPEGRDKIVLIVSKKDFILSILIPTYNRAIELKKNLDLLFDYIHQDKLEDRVCIIVSDNASPDATKDVIKPLTESDIHLEYFQQETNIGYCGNVLSILSKASTDWVMLLGDDDYLESWYIAECLQQIAEHPHLGCIIPNYVDYNPRTNKYGKLREENCETQYYKAGFDACLQNFWRAHQVSGLCFRKHQIVEEFQNRKMDNLYPQMFFIGYSALRYDALHYGEKCLSVSTIPQSKKDWGYGDDGLANDVLINIKNLNLSNCQRSQLEANYFKIAPRYMWVENPNIAIEKILLGKNMSFRGKRLLARQILHEEIYTGQKLRLRFYILARLVLLNKLIARKPIRL